jgi:hypothetical protein
MLIHKPMFTEPHGQKSACWANVASATLTRNSIHALCHMFRISFWPSFHEWTPKSVFSFEDYPNVISIPYTFELFWNTLHLWQLHRAQRPFLFIQTTATLGINDRVNETLGITVELKITSQVINFINQILSFFSYGVSYIVKNLN